MESTNFPGFSIPFAVTRSTHYLYSSECGCDSIHVANKQKQRKTKEIDNQKLVGHLWASDPWTTLTYNLKIAWWIYPNIASIVLWRARDIYTRIRTTPAIAVTSKQNTESSCCSATANGKFPVMAFVQDINSTSRTSTTDFIHTHMQTTHVVHVAKMTNRTSHSIGWHYYYQFRWCRYYCRRCCRCIFVPVTFIDFRRGLGYWCFGVCQASSSVLLLTSAVSYSNFDVAVPL